MDNAAARDNFVSGLYEQAVSQEKKFVLKELVAPGFSRLHREAAIHLHDLEGYRFVYNCCTPSLETTLAPEEFAARTDETKMVEIFEKLKNLITNLAVCQTGGIGFANFDGDIAATLTNLNIPCQDSNRALMADLMALFIRWINVTRTRYCREPYYISLNIGLSVSDWGRCIAGAVIDAYARQPMGLTRPNIIFKYAGSVNGCPGAPNYDLFQQALACTARKMVPTYLLMDSPVNQDCIPERLGIMGCRTRVYQNSNGPEGTVGRGNIAYVSINLPQIALRTGAVEPFFEELEKTALACRDILLARMNHLVTNNKLDFVFENKLWHQVSSVREMTKQGTLSLGFIGVAETVEILLGEKMHCSEKAQELAYDIVRHLRAYADRFRADTGYNFSLLATPGEMISGRFAEADNKKFRHPAIAKEFYTNSFHVEVDSGISLFDKLRLEGRFHALCNGGSISYVEFNDAPMDNILALEDLVGFAAAQGVSYLGFNYPLDICRDCGLHGTFDVCPVCGSDNIQRIRRVSGYLEDLNYFTRGKQREVRHRKSNTWE